MHTKGASRIALFGAVLLAAGTPAAENTADTALDAFKNGDPGLEFRLRFELVDQDNFAADGRALTLRSRLNFRTAPWRNLQAFVEFDDVSTLGVDQFNGSFGTTPGREQFPVIADPSDTRLNQAYLDFTPYAGFKLRGGRQRLQFDNDRFVGNVGWRQNEQIYDAGGVIFEPHPDWRVLYDYVFNVNRIFGNDVPAGDHEHNTHLVNITRRITADHQLTGYFYRIDNNDAAALSNRTAGLRYTGKIALAGGRSLALTGEYAHQNDAAQNPADFSADYWRGDIAWTFDPLLTLSAGYEVLAGDVTPGGAFRTPLATLHAFNGWADQFLNTPDSGIEDLFFGLGGKWQRLNWQIVWHRFDPEIGGGDFANELDAQLNVSLYKGISLLVKTAIFDASRDDQAGNFVDVTKFWTMLSARF